jgi:hypothetical protein
VIIVEKVLILRGRYFMVLRSFSLSVAMSWIICRGIFILTQYLVHSIYVNIVNVKV